MKVIIYAELDDLILAVRAAKALKPEARETIINFESRADDFYVIRNRSSLTVRQYRNLTPPND